MPEPGDIVWCKFPLRERPGHPGPWVRTTLVTESVIHEDNRTGRRFGSLWVSYGTDLRKVRDKRHFAVSTMAHARQIGLHKPTAFCFTGGNMKHLVWCAEYFIPPDYLHCRAIIMGRLSDEDREEVRKILEK